MMTATTTGRKRRSVAALTLAGVTAASVAAAVMGFFAFLSSDVRNRSMIGRSPSVGGLSGFGLGAGGEGLGRGTKGPTDRLCDDDLPVLHDSSPSVREGYDKMVRKSREWFDSYRLPDLVTLEGTGGGSFFRTTVSEKNWPAQSMAWRTDGEGEGDGEDNNAPIDIVKEDKSIPRNKCGVDTTWADPPSDPTLREADLTVRGDHVAFSGWYRGNFGHFTHDHVPVIAWLRATLSRGTKFLLPHDPLHENVLNVVDPAFVRERVVWIRYDQTVRLAEGKLTVVVPKKNTPFPCGFPQTAAAFTEHLRAWLEESKAAVHSDLNRKRTVVYYTRSGGTPRRLVEPVLEERIIQEIRDAMAQYGRTEELVIFNGKDGEGKTMSVQAQYDLFSTATAVIGPHGSGLTNVIWMDPALRPCGFRPKVLEFASSERTPDVQKGSFSAYWFLFGTMPWLEYRHLYYGEGSDGGSGGMVHVDIGDVRDALSAMWGRGEDLAVAK